MKTIEIDGREYGLALGPAILARLQGGLLDILPMKVQGKMQQYCKENGMDIGDIDNEHLPKFMTTEEMDRYADAAFMYETNLVKKALRTIDGERKTVDEVTAFLEEEMDADHFLKIVDVVNDAVLSFREAKLKKGESPLSSLQPPTGEQQTA